MLVLVGLTTQAQEFMVDGINYTKIPCGEYICTSYQVTVSPNPSGYSGDIVLPATVTFKGTTYQVLRIGANAFKGCSELTSVTGSEGYLSMVAFNAFQDCPKLRKVDLPSTIAVLDDNLFSGSPALDSIIIRSTTPPSAAFFDPFDGLNDHAVVVVRCGSLPAYQASEVFAGVTVVDDCGSPLDITEGDTMPRSLQVWPNPASGSIHVEALGEVELFDMAGHLLLRQHPIDGTISLAGIAPGIYLLRNGSAAVKVVVR